MSDKSCENCMYFKRESEGHTNGNCKYPVPEWLLRGASPYVYDTMGKNCPMFKAATPVKRLKFLFGRCTNHE